MAGRIGGTELSSESIQALRKAASASPPSWTGRRKPLASCHVLAEGPSWRIYDRCTCLERGGKLLHRHFRGGRWFGRWCFASSLEGNCGILRDKSETARWRGELAFGRIQLASLSALPASDRIAGLSGLLAITHGDTAVRPIPGAAREAADEWANEQLSDATFLEYATAEELQDEQREDEAEVAEDLCLHLGLEFANWKRPRKQHELFRLHCGASDRPRLCSGSGAALTAEDWRRLRAAAGAPPARLAGHERAPRAAVENNELAEEELLEAAELQTMVARNDALLGLLSTQAQLYSRGCRTRPRTDKLEK